MSEQHVELVKPCPVCASGMVEEFRASKWHEMMPSAYAWMCPNCGHFEFSRLYDGGWDARLSAEAEGA